jgi:SCY1-like protein 2
MLAAATSFFARTAITQSYNIGTPSHASRPSTPGTNGVHTASAPTTPAFYIGLWKVQSGSHKVTNKRVSVWTFDKRGPEVERLSSQGKDRSVEIMKAEVSCSNYRPWRSASKFGLQASALGRLRHPSILGELFSSCIHVAIHAYMFVISQRDGGTAGGN